MDYLSLTACIKNEERYVQEWLTYYKSIGVEKFYIYNNESTDLTENKINELPFRNDITLIDFKTDNLSPLGLSFQRAKEHYGKKTEWMLFCDSDEFFMPTEPIDLKVFLQQYEDFSGLGAAWQIYGSNGHILRPEGFSIENFVYKAPILWEGNHHIKSIVKPKDIISKHTRSGYITSHMWSTIKGTVDEHFNLINECDEGRLVNITIDKIRVNHYFNRSYEDWIDKRRRGRGTGAAKRPLEMFDIYDRNDIYDDTALKYVNAVRALLPSNNLL